MAKKVDVQAKVKKYETFLNDQLRPDLKSVLEDRDKIYEDISEYSALKNSIEAIQSAGDELPKPLKIKTDLGSNFYVRANVPNPENIFLDVGLGFFLELSLSEALVFIEKKVKLLEEKSNLLTEQSLTIKANIKLILHGLREIQGLSADDLNKPIYDPLQ